MFGKEGRTAEEKKYNKIKVADGYRKQSDIGHTGVWLFFRDLSAQRGTE